MERRIPGSLALITALAVVLAGCGKGGASPRTTTPAVTPIASPSTGAPQPAPAGVPTLAPPIALPTLDPSASVFRPDRQELYVVNDDGTGLRQLDSVEAGAIGAAPSPDGSTLALTIRPPGHPEKAEFRLVDVASGRSRQPPPSPSSLGFGTRSWSPDGSRLIVANGSARVTGGMIAYRLWALASGDAVPFNASAYAQPLGWSPDSSRFYYYVPYGVEGEPGIYAVHARDGAIETIVRENAQFGPVALSADGLYIAVAAPEPGSTPERLPPYEISVQGTSPGAVPHRVARLTEPSPAGVLGLAWSPDGSALAFGWAGDAADPAHGAYVVNVTSNGAPRRITKADANRWDVEPHWSPDGRWLLVSRYSCVQCDSRGKQTILAAADGSSSTPLPPNADAESDATWWPDGARFVHAGDAVTVAAADAPLSARTIAQIPASRYDSVSWAGGRVFFVRSQPDVTVTYALRPGDATAEPAIVSDFTSVSATGAVASVEVGAVRIRDARGERGIAVPSIDTLRAAAGAHPVWSPDGMKLALGAAGFLAFAPQAIVLTSGADGGWSARGINLDPPGGSLAWSPDGSRLAYVAEHGVYALDPAAGGPARLVLAGDGASALDWAPDGRSIAVVAGELKVVAADGSGPVVQPFEFPDLGLTAARWSPDGRRIAAVANGGIFIITVATREMQRFPVDGLSGICWSPDGASVAFDAVDQDGLYRLATIRADATQFTTIAASYGRLLAPERWAGDRVIFRSAPTGP